MYTLLRPLHTHGLNWHSHNPTGNVTAPTTLKAYSCNLMAFITFSKPLFALSASPSTLPQHVLAHIRLLPWLLTHSHVIHKHSYNALPQVALSWLLLVPSRPPWAFWWPLLALSCTSWTLLKSYLKPLTAFSGSLYTSPLTAFNTLT